MTIVQHESDSSFKVKSIKLKLLTTASLMETMIDGKTVPGI